MTFSAPVAVTSAAATLGSSQRDGQEPPLSSLHQYDTVQANGNRSTGNAARAHNSDLICVGMWVNKGEHQETNTPMNGVHLLALNTACTRHRKLSEACSPSASDLQIARILTKPHTIDSTDDIRDGGAGGSSAAVCTCVVAFEVYEDEAEPRKARTNGSAASEKRLNGTR